MTVQGIKGSSDRSVLVLTSLAGGSKHGYALIKDIEEFAGYQLDAGLGGWASGSTFRDVDEDGLTLSGEQSGEDGVVVPKLHELGVGE